MPFNAEEELLKIHEVNTWNYAKIIKEADKINEIQYKDLKFLKAIATE